MPGQHLEGGRALHMLVSRPSCFYQMTQMHERVFLLARKPLAGMYVQSVLPNTAPAHSASLPMNRARRSCFVSFLPLSVCSS